MIVTSPSCEAKDVADESDIGSKSKPEQSEACSDDGWIATPTPSAFSEVRLRLRRLSGDATKTVGSQQLEPLRPIHTPLRRSFCIVEASSEEQSEMDAEETQCFELFLGEVRGWRSPTPTSDDTAPWSPPPEAEASELGRWLTEAALCLSVGEAADFEPVEAPFAAASGGLAGRRRLRLLRVDRAMDLLGDGSLMLRVLDTGPGGQKPRDLGKVSADWRVWFLRNGELVLDWGRGHEFVVDEATVMVALDLALREMEAGSRAVLRVSEEWGSGPLTPMGMQGLCLRGAAVWVELRLHEVQNEPGPGEHDSIDDALAFAFAKKEQGNKCFMCKNSADDHRALRRYTTGIETLEATLGIQRREGTPGGRSGSVPIAPTGTCESEAQRPAVLEALAALRLNAAQAELRRGKWREAIEHCDAVLQAEPNVKAHFRRGVAQAELGLLSEAVADLRAAATASPADVGIRKELARVDALHKAQRAEERSTFGGVFDKMRQREAREEAREEERRKLQAKSEQQQARANQAAAQNESRGESKVEVKAEEVSSESKAKAEARAAAEAKAKAEAEATARAEADAKAKAAALAREVAERGGDGAAACSLKAQELVQQLKASGKIPSTMQQVTTVENPEPVDYAVPSFLAGQRKKKTVSVPKAP